MFRKAAATVVVLTACAPEGGQEDIHIPTLAEVSAEGDGALELIDRESVLADAVEGEEGDAPDLSGKKSAFYMEIDSGDVAELEVPNQRTYLNVAAGITAAALADAATLYVVGPPSAAIRIAAAGTIEQIEPFAWTATNSVTGPNGVTTTGRFTAAWVGVGWLAEMRLTSDNGVYDDTLWFNGFLSNDGLLGWWDLWANDAVVGVVEWVGDGTGDKEGQSGIAALAGDPAGDVLSYLHRDGQWTVSYWDDSASFESHVFLDSDQSGEVLLPNYNGAEVGCWDAELSDVDCD